MKQLRLTRQQICEILGVAKSGLKTIENKNQLAQRLNDKGYKLLEKQKVGRNNVYVVEQFNSRVGDYTNICNYVMNTNEYDKFADYYLYRTCNVQIPITQGEICKLVGINKNTLTKWDKKMVECEILGKEGFWYIAREYNFETKKHSYYLTCEEDYKNFMKTYSKISKKKKLMENYKKGLIDDDTFLLALDTINDSEEYIKQRIVYKVNKYCWYAGGLSEELSNLIEELYDYDLVNYILSYKNIE